MLIIQKLYFIWYAISNVYPYILELNSLVKYHFDQILINQNYFDWAVFNHSIIFNLMNFNGFNLKLNYFTNQMIIIVNLYHLGVIVILQFVIEM
jgi:hypothetical protein